MVRRRYRCDYRNATVPFRIARRGTCASLADALAGSLYVVAVNGPEDVEVHGVVSDGIDFVQLLYADGTSTGLRVTDNYYYFRARKATSSIAVTDTDGVERIWPATARFE